MVKKNENTGIKSAEKVKSEKSKPANVAATAKSSEAAQPTKSRKAHVYGLDGKVLEEVELPAVFATEVREEIIRRAVLAEETWEKQPKGNYRWAGLETSARYVGRKEAYATLKNRGQSRLPREFFGGGRPGRVRYIPSAVSGRRAHPPKPEKNIYEKINKKEHDLALRSAIAATADAELAKARGHRISLKASKASASGSETLEELPIILSSEKLPSKTKEFFAFISSLVPEDVEKAKAKRGPNKKHPKTVLVVAAPDEEALIRAARNVPGVDAISAAELLVKYFAPGGHPGRLTVYTEKALALLDERWKE